MMNAIAMNQTLFGNLAVFGQGFTEGQNSGRTETVNGWMMYVNGLNPLPDVPSEYNWSKLIGVVEHECLMIGMPSAGGTIEYHLVETDEAFALVVGVKLDPYLMGESEMHYQYAAIMMKDDLVIQWRPKNDDAFHLAVMRNLFYGHFMAFLDSKDPEMTVNDFYFGEDSGSLEEIFKDYIQILEDLKC